MSSTSSTAGWDRPCSTTGGCTGTTVYDGKVAFRPAIVNRRTGSDDVDLYRSDHPPSSKRNWPQSG